jgi:predicted AAA+ superfamily ATPase
MKIVNRILYEAISEHLDDSKAIILLGPRQSGKTTLLRCVSDILKKPVLWLNGDETDVRIRLSSPTSTALRQIIGDAKTVLIDEAQRIENIGICIKLIVDNMPGVKVIVTGSSAFELANRISEPLTGRKWEYVLLPFSYEEMSLHHGQTDERRLLEHRLIYGYYPDVVNNPGKERELLRELAGSYLYRDILSWQNIKKPDKLEKLVQSLAFQIGNEVSYHELAQNCGLDNETVERYMDLLEKAFIVFRLRSFSRNMRNEIKKSRKVYFYDNGLRNSVVNNFNPAGIRDDMGALWENFLVCERLKCICFHRLNVNRYFWRTHAQQEIDYLEEHDGKLHAFEFKWNPNRKVRFPKAFLDSYPGSETKTISRDNIDEWLKRR